MGKYAFDLCSRSRDSAVCNWFHCRILFRSKREEPMRILKTLLLLTFTASCFAQTNGAVTTATGSTNSPRGIYLADLKTSVDPCTDFFDYANGTWRDQNPIPASMVRWSRRWKSGEDAKTQLKDILDEVSAKTDWPKGSVEQLIGDFYGACTDAAAINKAGIEPIRPLLAE